MEFRVAVFRSSFGFREVSERPEHVPPGHRVIVLRLAPSYVPSPFRDLVSTKRWSATATKAKEIARPMKEATR
jgi:hypothetical protein